MPIESASGCFSNGDWTERTLTCRACGYKAWKSNRFVAKQLVRIILALMTKSLTKQKTEQLMSIITSSWKSTSARGRIGRQERDDVHDLGFRELLQSGDTRMHEIRVIIVHGDASSNFLMEL